MSAPCACSERPNAKIAPSSSSLAARCLALGVRALPDRAQPEDRDLPRVPVLQPVEGADLVERADSRGVPALARRPARPGRLARRRQEGGEKPLARDEGKVVRIPDTITVVGLQPLLAA